MALFSWREGFIPQPNLLPQQAPSRVLWCTLGSGVKCKQLKIRVREAEQHSVHFSSSEVSVVHFQQNCTLHSHQPHLSLANCTSDRLWLVTAAVSLSGQTNYLLCEEPAAVAAFVVTASAVFDAVAAAVGLLQWRYPAAAKGTLPAGSAGWTGFREGVEEP